MHLRHRSELLIRFGRRVKKLRLEKGITPSKFEALSRIDVGNLAKYENGEREPGLVMIVMIARALEIDHLELLDFSFDYKAMKKSTGLD